MFIKKIESTVSLMLFNNLQTYFFTFQVHTRMVRTSSSTRIINRNPGSKHCISAMAHVSSKIRKFILCVPQLKYV